MRHRRFRPSFDSLDFRIAPSGSAPGPITTTGSPYMADPGFYEPPPIVPGDNDDLAGTMGYCSGNESGTDPFNPDVNPN